MEIEKKNKFNKNKNPHLSVEQEETQKKIPIKIFVRYKTLSSEKKLKSGKQFHLREQPEATCNNVTSIPLENTLQRKLYLF